MSAFAGRLQREVRVSAEFTTKLATTIAAEVRLLPDEVKSDLRSATPVSIKDRLSEVQAFQSWMVIAPGVRSAHANWTYFTDFNELVYWARKGADADEIVQRLEVEQHELAFWQSLFTCLAYAALTNISEA